MPPLSTMRGAPFLLWMWYIFVLYCAAIRLPQQIDHVNQEAVKKQYGCSKHRHCRLTGCLDAFIFIARSRSSRLVVFSLILGVCAASGFRWGHLFFRTLLPFASRAQPLLAGAHQFHYHELYAAEPAPERTSILWRAFWKEIDSVTQNELLFVCSVNSK